MTKFIFILILFFSFPIHSMAANYGDGNYGAGNYNVGDASAPVNGSLTYTNGYHASTTINITVNDGTDSDSGINTSSRILQRQSATLSNGTCGSYDSFSPITPTGTYPDFFDSTIVSGNCYIYRYLVSDNSTNQAMYTTANIVKVDTSPPSTPDTPTTTNPTNSSSQTWNWSVATDTVSGIFNYLWRTTGSAIVSGTSVTNSVVTSLTEGVYNFFVHSVDNAGNAGSESSAGTLTVDTTSSVISSVSSNNPNSTSTSITWATNENSSSKVEYGLTNSYGSTTPETDTSTRVLSHSVSLSNLVSCTTYHYRVKSIDLSLNEAVSSDYNFTTAGCTASSPIDSQSSSQIVSGIGGTLNLLDNNSHGLGLSIPASFSGSDANFQAHQLDATTVLATTSNPVGYLISGNYIYELKALTDNSSTITTFDNPVTITMSYGIADITNLDETSLKIYRWNGSVWNQLTGCIVNTSAKTVTCTTIQFSTFGLFGQESQTPTPTPTNTPTSTPTPTVSQNNNSNNNDIVHSAPNCNNTVLNSPNLFQANTSGTSIKLFFTPVKNSDKYYISYSTNTNAEEYGVEATLNNIGIQNFIINLLKPNSTYYFKVRGQNGCMPGNWSNILKVKTRSLKINKKINLTPVPTMIKTKIVQNKETLPTPSPTSSPTLNTPQNNNQKTKSCFLWWCW